MMIIPEENDNLIKKYNNQNSSMEKNEKNNTNFHNFIMSFKNNLNSPKLEMALLETTNEQFQQLKGLTFFY